MSLVLLVEGTKTEPAVYASWLQHALPGIQAVDLVAQLAPHSYVMVKGGGYPSCFNRIAALLKDIDQHPGKADAFWICLDADETEPAVRWREAVEAVERESKSLTLARTNPTLDVRVIVQNCCIETWFLGHTGLARKGTQSPDYVKCRQFYDVSKHDPEAMDKPSGWITRQSFHLDYLRKMFDGHGKSYSKKSPGMVCEQAYFDALRTRRAQTAHLDSFGDLLDALRAAGANV